MRPLAIVLIILVSCLTSWVVLDKALTNPKTWSKYLPKILNNKDFKLLSIRAEKIDIEWLRGEVVINQLNLKLRYKDQTYYYSATRVDIISCWSLLMGRPIVVKGIASALVSDAVNVSNLNYQTAITIRNKSIYDLQGYVDIGQLYYQEYLINTFKSVVDYRQDRLSLSNMSGLLYEGNFQGAMVYDLKEQWIKELSLTMMAINLTLLDNVNKEKKAYVRGVYDGSININYDRPGQLKVFQIRGSLIKEGKIDVQLLKYLVQYLPSYEQLQAVINKNGFVDITNAVIDINRSSSDSITSSIKFLSPPPVNLDVNTTIELRIDEPTSRMLWQNLRDILNVY